MTKERLLNKAIFHQTNLKSEKVKPWSQDWLIAAGAYPGFCSMKRLEVFLLPRNLSGFPNNLLVPIYTPGWREAL